jgi:hypothetical protein
MKHLLTPQNILGFVLLLTSMIYTVVCAIQTTRHHIRRSKEIKQHLLDLQLYEHSS